MTELKPCPFCGGTGRIQKVFTIWDTVPIKWTVICCDCGFMTDIKGTKDAAIRLWNSQTGSRYCGRRRKKMPIEYYIGVAVGIISVLIAYVLSKLTRHDSMCDKCNKLRSKDWKGWYFCSEEGYHYFVPEYCSLYKEREDEHEST